MAAEKSTAKVKAGEPCQTERIIDQAFSDLVANVPLLRQAEHHNMVLQTKIKLKKEIKIEQGVSS